MATITKQGKGYKISVHKGYDYRGKRLREHMTWVPDPGMSDRQIEKELNRQATLFEERVKRGNQQDGRIKFADFAEKYMEDYGNLHLKPKPRITYIENLRKINMAIGHIKLCNLSTAHINEFYRNLQEEGIREKVVATCKIDLAAFLKDNKLSLTKFAEQSGLSRSTIKAAIEKHNVSKDSAEKISAVLNINPTSAFEFHEDKTPLAPATIHAYHRTLSAILSKAVRWGYIQANPADNAEKPPLGNREAAYLEEADARRLLELLQKEPIRWRAVLTFDLLSGLRRGEVLGLRWCDVNFNDSTITIRQTSNYIPEKGVYIGTPKTDKSMRPLRLSSAAMTLLKEYKQWQDAQKEKLWDAWEDKDGRVFTTDNGAPIFPDGVTQWFTKFVKRSGLPKITVHSLRHTYATLMIADGTPLVVVSRQMGHAQASTTANIYAHAIASAQAKAAQTFDRFNDLITPENKKVVGD